MTRSFASILGAAGVAAALSLPGLASAQTAAPQRGGTAIFTLNQDPTTVNPAVTSNVPDRLVGCILYQGLVQMSVDYKILPLLAKSWTISPDGLTYTFDLNPAEWHDGTPFTAEDVKYSLIEVNAKVSAIFAAAGRAIESVEAPTKDKVVVKLKQSFGPFLISLACTQGGAIMPAHVFRGTDPLKNPATLDKPVGTGPFKLQEWKRGDQVRLVKNAKYHEAGKPYLDEVVGKVIGQPSARVQALQAGEVDIVQFFTANDQAAVKANPKLKVVTSDISPSSVMLFFNNNRKPFDDKRVRQALFMGTDRDYFIKNAWFDVGSVGTAPFTTDISWAANPNIDYRKQYSFDQARANKLLDDAGVKRGADGKRFAIKIIIFANQYPEFQQVALSMKSMWAPLGVDVQIEALEDQTLVKRVFTDRDFDATLQVYTSYADPALGICRTFISSSIGRIFGNASGYSNPEVDGLCEQGERATKLEDRSPFYQKAQAILAEDLPVLQIRQYREIEAASKRLEGLWGKVQGTGLWSDAWLAK